MPGMNTTSYPRLIKALREALPDKLLTLVDKGMLLNIFMMFLGVEELK